MQQLSKTNIKLQQPNTQNMKAYTTTDKAEAKAIAAKLDNATYRLGHGEHSRPQYTVRKVRRSADFEIYAKYFYYAGTFNCRQNGAICVDTVYNA